MDPVYVSKETPLTLDSFREQLIRQEETIIFALIERAQFPTNNEVYKKNEPNVSVDGNSLLDYMLRETESVHARVRRFTSPDESAFFKESTAVRPLLPLIDFPSAIMPNSINVNDKIKSLYHKQLLPKLTASRSDPRTFGSTSVADIACLQALSKRIHFGKFIAEAKFQADTETYSKLIKQNDGEGIMKLLTNKAVEKRVIERVELKSSTYGQDPQDPTKYEQKVDPKLIGKMYEDIVMPLTKEVQVVYLLQRLEHPTIACFGENSNEAVKQEYGSISQSLVELCDSAEVVFSNVLSNNAAYGVVPLEAKTTGIVKATKLLLFSSNLSIIAEQYVTTETDTIRYVILGKEKQSPSGTDKTALAFGVSHSSGALFTALESFKTAGVNLLTLESLPTTDCYAFFIELVGHIDDDITKCALESLKKCTTFVQELGSYQSRQ